MHSTSRVKLMLLDMLIFMPFKINGIESLGLVSTADSLY